MGQNSIDESTAYKSLSFNGTDEEKKALRYAASKAGVTVGQAVRMAILTMFGADMDEYFFMHGGNKYCQLEIEGDNGKKKIRRTSKRVTAPKSETESGETSIEIEGES